MNDFTNEDPSYVVCISLKSQIGILHLDRVIILACISNFPAQSAMEAHFWIHSGCEQYSPILYS